MNYYFIKTSECFQIPIAELLSRKHDRVLSDARTAFAAICRDRLKARIVDVAEFLKRDHSTISLYYKNLRDIPDVQLKYQVLCKYIDHPPSDLIAHIDKRKEQRKKLAELFNKMRGSNK